MGRSKAALPWYGSTLLRRTVGIVARAVDGPVVVVRAPRQQLPKLPPEVEILDDDTAGLGPLQGLAVGLAAVADRAEVAYVSSTDLPFLHCAFVRAVMSRFDDADDDADVVLPVVGGFRQPLAAGYRTTLAPKVASLVSERRLKPAFLFDSCRVVRLDEAALLADPALAAFDPELTSLVNVNAPDDYEAALLQPSPLVTVDSMPVRAATLAEAAAGVPFTYATIDGHQTADPTYPLVTGDTVWLA
jgi:molybdopterin-guanine dinucleotide biosynthesis protein A